MGIKLKDFWTSRVSDNVIEIRIDFDNAYHHSLKIDIGDSKDLVVTKLMGFAQDIEHQPINLTEATTEYDPDTKCFTVLKDGYYLVSVWEGVLNLRKGDQVDQVTGAMTRI